MTPIILAALVFTAVAVASWIERDRERPRSSTGQALRDAATTELLEELRATHGGEVVSHDGYRVLRITRSGTEVLVGAVHDPMRVVVNARARWALPAGPTFSLSRRSGLDVHPPRVLTRALDERLRASLVGADVARMLVTHEAALLRLEHLDSTPRWIEARAARTDLEASTTAIELVARLASVAIEPLVELAEREAGELVRGADGVVSVELGSDAGIVRVRGAESVSAYLAGARGVSASLACDLLEPPLAGGVGDDGALRPATAEIARSPRAVSAASRAGRFTLVRGGGELRVAWAAMPSSVELSAGIELLAAFASHTPRQGVFR